MLDYSKSSYPNPTMHDLLILCEEMSRWLDSNPTNLLFIHCQQSFTRTGVVLICLLQFLKFHKSYQEILTFVMDKLNLTFLNNQKLYLKYIESAFNLVPLNKHPLKIRKITLSKVPFIKLLKEHAEDPILSKASKFRPYL